MTAADWGILIPAVVGFLVACTAYLKSHDAQATAYKASSTAANTQNVLSDHIDQDHG